MTKDAPGENGQAAKAVGQDMPTILVVDDEPGIVEPLAKIFEKESLRVLTAKGEPRRWSFCAANQFRFC